MLANNHICKVQSQNFALEEEKHLSSILSRKNNNNEISAIVTLNEIFTRNSKVTSMFAKEALDVLKSAGLCKDDAWSDNYIQLATYGVCLSNLYFVFDFDKSSFELFTSSISILRQLATKGYLIGKKEPIAIEMERLQKALFASTRIRDSIKKGGLIQGCRLDPQVQGTVVKFVPTIPRSQIDLDKQVIVPFQVVNKCMDLLNGVLQSSILRITMGDKVRTVTKNESYLTAIYGRDRASYLLTGGYDARIGSFYVPSVGASIYTAGITNIKLPYIDKIEILDNINGIDMSEINVDYSMSKHFLAQKVKKFNKSQCEEILSDFDEFKVNMPKTTEDMKDALNSLSNLTDREVYDIFKRHQNLFSLEEYSNIKSKYGSRYEYLQVPNSQKELEELLRTGIFKILITSRNGSLSTMICTNSSKELSRIYGANYYGVYESKGVRLKSLEQEVKGYSKSIKTDDLDKLLSKYNLGEIHDNLNMYIANYESLEEIEVSSVLEEILALQNKIENKRTVVKQPNLIVVRNCDSKLSEEGYPVNYYKNLDIKSIRSIIRLSKTRNTSKEDK